MTRLKDRGFAAAVSVVMFVVSLFGGSYRSVASFNPWIEQPYYEGVYHSDGNFNTPSIETQIDVRIDASLSAATSLSKYGELESLCGELIQCRKQLLTTMAEGADNAEDLAKLNIELGSLFETLREAALSLPELSAEDEKALDYHTNAMRGSQAVITEAAREGLARIDSARQKTSGFPGLLWTGILTGIEKYAVGAGYEIGE